MLVNDNYTSLPTTITLPCQAANVKHYVPFSKGRICFMITPDRKVRKLMEEYQKTGSLSRAALSADLDQKTARKYLKASKMPSQMRVDHTWKTRADPFAAHWKECEHIFETAPELEAKFVFEWLCENYPDVYQEGQLRTFQRRVSDWRALKGPEREVYFPQIHIPGKRMSTDCTHTEELGITINHEPFSHLLCHCVLTYSNWEWATICHSESLLALRTGIQSALFQLGRVPLEHWTDNSSAATHVPAAQEGPGRKFNQGYLDIMEHFGMKPHTIQIGAAHENGDVESLNGVLKRRLKQHLLMRGSSDFDDLESYRDFLEKVLNKANDRRSDRLAEELKQMTLLNASKLTEYDEHFCRVRSSCSITINRRIYTVPSRLIGEKVLVRQYESHIDVLYKNILQFTAPWMTRDSDPCINYRHVIKSLIRKPGAFRNYRFREGLFPSDIFRWAWECLSAKLNERTAEREFLQLLHRAATTMQCEVETALSSLRNEGKMPRVNLVLERCPLAVQEPLRQKDLVINLEDYNQLLFNKETLV